MLFDGAGHVGENQVLEVEPFHRPGGIENGSIGSHDEGALFVGVALGDDRLIARQGVALVPWARQTVMGREQLVDLTCDADPGVDENDQVVTDPLEVSDKV